MAAVPSWALAWEDSSDSEGMAVEEEEAQEEQQQEEPPWQGELQQGELQRPPQQHPVQLEQQAGQQQDRRGTPGPPLILPSNPGQIVYPQQQIQAPFYNLFSAFRSFNAVQSECFNIAACSDENMVVAAPTGCGKTVILELGILRLMCEAQRRGTQRLPGKIVFLAPIKALCSEKFRDWSNRFGGQFGLRCLELTGDMASLPLNEIHAAQIIVTTPGLLDWLN